MQLWNRRATGGHERVANRGALEGTRGVVCRAEGADEHAHGLGRRDPSEGAERRRAQGRGSIGNERRDRVHRVRRAHATERGKSVVADFVALIAKGEGERRRSARVVEIAECSSHCLPDVGGRVLHLAGERHDSALVPEPGQRCDDLHPHRRGRIIEAAQQGRHRVSGRLMSERLGRSGADLWVRVAQCPRERRHRTVARKGARDVARLASKSHVRRVEPRRHRLRRTDGAQSYRGFGRRQAHFVVRVCKRTESERGTARRPDRRKLPRRRATRRGVGRREVALHALGDVRPHHRAGARRSERQQRQRDPGSDASHGSPPRLRAIQCTPSRKAAAVVHAQGGATGVTWRSALTIVGLGSGSELAPDANANAPPVAFAMASRRPGSGRESDHSSPPASHAKS